MDSTTTTAAAIRTYRITNATGQQVGTWSADSPATALELARQAGTDTTGCEAAPIPTVAERRRMAGGSMGVSC